MKSLRLLTLLAASLVPLLAEAGPFLHHGSCCSDCGCSHVKKVCRLVPEVKKVPQTKYSVECEDICLQGPSKRCGVKWVPDCDCFLGCRKEVIWEPRCGCVKTRKRLKKTITNIDKPGFKCVVETVCCKCGCARLDGQASEDVQRYVDALPDEELEKLGELVSAGREFVPQYVTPDTVRPVAAEEPVVNANQ